MRKYIASHRRRFAVIAGTASFAIAVLYLWLIPDKAVSAVGYQKIILLYGHSICWILLSGASFAWGIFGEKQIANCVCLCGTCGIFGFFGYTTNYIKITARRSQIEKCFSRLLVCGYSLYSIHLLQNDDSEE